MRFANSSLLYSITASIGHIRTHPSYRVQCILTGGIFYGTGKAHRGRAVRDQLHALRGLRFPRPEVARRKELRLGAIRQSEAPAFAEMSQGADFQHAVPGWLFENGRSGDVGDDGTIVRSKTVIFGIVFDL